MIKKFYITTSIPYASSSPHVGNILDSLYADVLARFWRQYGADVRFLTGSDEHGVKIVRTAESLRITPKELVDKNSSKIRSLKESLNLSWDDFIRTSDKERHWAGANKIWTTIEANGDLYKKTYEGQYCVGHEAFITEKDLENGFCRDHKKKPEIIREDNWFFRLSKYSKEIEFKIKNNELIIIPESKKSEILSLLEIGLEDVSFSRPSKDLSWGVPVPGDTTQTMYVWADALTNYISALGYGSSDESLYEKYWPADVQVIGKDNLRFHAAIWPGMLLSAKINLPKVIFVHGFLTVDGQKISKTIGNIIDPFELVKKYGIDSVRYYLLREIPPFEDGDFSYKKFEERYNSDLANGLGNFSARVLTLAEKNLNSKIVSAEYEDNVDREVDKKIKEAKKLVAIKIEEFKFHEAIASIWDLISFGDGYINEKKPWETKDEMALLNLIVILDNLAFLLKPFLPETSCKISGAIQWTNQGMLKISKIQNLFNRLIPNS